MKIKEKLKKWGFTLIELLVVITIIGILGTGAVAVYTSQIQKARDSTRINDVKVLESAVEQVYWDDSDYPHANEFVTKVNKYVKRLPSDPKHGSPCNRWGGTWTSGDCAYAYLTSTDENWIAYWSYEISTSFENKWNVDSKAAKDSGNDDVRWEAWNKLDTNTTIGDVSSKKWACTTAWSKATLWTALIVVNWNPSVLTNQCDNG